VKSPFFDMSDECVLTTVEDRCTDDRENNWTDLPPIEKTQT